MSDQPVIDPMKDPNVKIVRAKGKPGAQPGNTNALRHGFYAKNLGIASPRKYNEAEHRNLLSEAAMLKDYMYILYNCNLEVRDSAVLAETLRALSLASMALARLLQVHCQVRILSSSDSTLSELLTSMDAATTRANRYSSRDL